MSDQLVRAISKDGFVKAAAVSTRALTERARQIHQTSPVATAALGRLLAAGSMMGNELKGDGSSVTLRIKGDGPLGTLLVVADNEGNVRGSVQNPQIDLPIREDGKLDVGGALGNGLLSVIRDMGLKEPYVGQTALQTGEIAEDLTYYFATSDQIPSSVALGVLFNDDTSVANAGGFIIQLMPFAEDALIDELEKRLKGFSFTALLKQGMSVEAIIRKLFEGYDVELTDSMPCAYVCDCSKERVEQAVISLGRKELGAMIADNKPIEVVCDFCHTKYTFSPDELLNILKNK